MKTTTRPFRLPTLEAFRALTLRQRAALFVKWAARRGEETYHSGSLRDCAIASFGAALGASGNGVNYGFRTTHGGEDIVQVLPRSEGDPNSPIHPEGTLSTYAALVRRTKLFLARTDLQWEPKRECL